MLLEVRLGSWVIRKKKLHQVTENPVHISLDTH
jgi:hypothetical protein